MSVYPLVMARGSARRIAETDEQRCVWLKEGFRVMPDPEQADALAAGAGETEPDQTIPDESETEPHETEHHPAKRHRGRPKKADHS